MRERQNKPKVFLSHAHKDVEFIKKVQSDLRSCQIESWRDEDDIRDGQPWLEAIFEDGIPTCDAILAYFTPHSLASAMVGKEVDSAIIRRLSDSNVAFLPYVSAASVRDEMRVDLRTLQCREWNDQNYHEIFPRIVSEIWRSFMERTVAIAIASEKTARLEAELELSRIKEERVASVFTKSEDIEFEYIRKQLDIPIEVKFDVFDETLEPNGSKSSLKSGKCICQADFLGFLIYSKRVDQYYVPTGSSIFETGEFVKSKISETRPQISFVDARSSKPNWYELLSRYGLIDYVPDNSNGRVWRSSSHIYTEKMGRFMFWLEFNDLIPDEPNVEVTNFEEIESTPNAE